MMQTQQLQPPQAFIDCPLLAEMDNASLDSLLASATVISLPAQQLVIKQGDLGNEMYLVLRGKLEVSVVLPNGDAMVINQVCRGESFGEIALFDQRQRTASVSTLSSCKLLVIERKLFVDFLYDHPGVAIQLLNIFAKQIRTTNNLMKDSLFANIGHRLAKTINDIAHAYGRHTPRGLKIDSPFSDKELGEISGLPTDIVNSHLHDWQVKGLISVKQGYITILHPEELNKLESRFT